MYEVSYTGSFEPIYALGMCFPRACNASDLFHVYYAIRVMGLSTPAPSEDNVTVDCRLPNDSFSVLSSVLYLLIGVGGFLYYNKCLWIDYFGLHCWNYC